MPVGTILPYVGDLANIPDGWHLCDGTDGTPDLTARFLEGTIATPGIYKEPGLPDATGQLHVSDTGHAFWNLDGNGVFTPLANGLTGRMLHDNYHAGTYLLKFALSSSNIIFGSSNTVQPRSYTVLYIIKIE
ncbi:hypothetical protein [Anaerovibrio sp.]|uniref:hypothetical protein n=1 Tax=Anaerovibrio sp. TaxID=1872532 RepID=UPI003890C106